MLFRSAYLHLVVDHSLSQSQPHVNSYCQYLVNSDSYGKRYYRHQYSFKYMLSNGVLELVDRWPYLDFIAKYWLSNNAIEAIWSQQIFHNGPIRGVALFKICFRFF